MPSVFTRILSGEADGRVLFQDAACAVLLAATPLRPGHALVVPRLEIDHWLDLPPALGDHAFRVAAWVGRHQRRLFPCAKVGLLVAGIEVRHAHLHLVPIAALADLDLARQDRSPDPAMMDAAERVLRDALGNDAGAPAAPGYL